MEQAGVGRFWPSSTVRSRGACWTGVPMVAILAWVGLAVASYLAGPALATTRPELAHLPLGVLLGVAAATTLVVACTEELLFRGWVLGRLTAAWGASRHGVYLAAITSSLAFGAAHLVDALPVWDLLLVVGEASVLGWLWAGMRLCSGSIWPSVVFHAGWNLTGMLGRDPTGGHPTILTGLALVAITYGAQLVKVFLDGRDREQLAVAP
jgi:membrane protease YdiL (CAAX protease family)